MCKLLKKLSFEVEEKERRITRGESRDNRTVYFKKRYLNLKPLVEGKGEKGGDIQERP